jgi:hypothetical protein
VAFKTCLEYQLVENEEPFYPPGAIELGIMYKDKNATDGLATNAASSILVKENGTYGAYYDTYVDMFRSQIIVGKPQSKTYT